MSTFSEIWFYTKISTSALTNVLRILTTEAPVAHQSARHSQRRSAELTCSSSQKPTIVHARFVQHNLAASSRRPCTLSPRREDQAERASHEQRSRDRMTAQHDAGSRPGPAHRGNYAAMWNRIDRLRRDRARKGSSTVMNWIQSHVQDEAKRVSTSSNIECACRAASGCESECTVPGEECHWMHEGE